MTYFLAHADTRYSRPEGRPARLRWIAVALAALVSAIPPLEAQSIRGTVASQTTEEGIAAATVALVTQDGTIKSIVLTDSTGSYSFRTVEPGVYSLRVDATGFNTLNGSPFRARPGQSVTFDLRLWELTEMAPVVVEAERQPYAPGPLAGFYERREMGRGSFITREEIERQGSIKFTDVLRMVPGIDIVAIQGGYTVRMRNTIRLSGVCPPVLWVDNVQWGPIDLGGSPDRELFPSQLEGIEIYTPVQVPLEFGSKDAQCGVVVVWTKRAPSYP